MKRRIGIGAAALVAVVAAIGLWAPWKDRTPPLEVESLRIDRGPIVSRISASGTVSARTTVLVGSQVSGRIQEIFVDFNGPVTKGQLLARIDPRVFDAQVEQARANVTAARAQIAKAKAQADEALRDLERKARLDERRLIASVDLDAARARAEVAKAEVQAAESALVQAAATLRQAELNVTYTAILSPIDGVVISRDVDVGQTVAASLQTPTLFTLAEDLRKMQVHTNVAESDVAKVVAGNPASFTVDAYPGRLFEGTIREVRNAAQTTQNVVTYDAVIDVENPDLALKPGMTASVSFVLEARDDVLRLPNAALRFRPPGEKAPPPNPGERTIWLEGPEGLRPVSVKVGITDGTFTEVLEGAAEGDRAVVDARGSGRAPAPRIRMGRRGF
ncbi:MAG TPA: efflux RND transporter periplasmic adaptor subunit [Vulgatibacter sp.]|nr:efflux RND transporter periplasmic adaptor subunit [Vulgatibacter sp.]